MHLNSKQFKSNSEFKSQMINVFNKASELNTAIDLTFKSIKENQLLLNSLLNFISRKVYNINGLHQKQI